MSDAVMDLLDALEGPREALLEAQTAAGCERWNDALLVDLRLAGLVEAWAAGEGVTLPQIVVEGGGGQGGLVCG